MLYTFLEKEWRYRNHSKYQKYFKTWFAKLTTNQINSFTKEMNRIKHIIKQ